MREVPKSNATPSEKKKPSESEPTTFQEIHNRFAQSNVRLWIFKIFNATSPKRKYKRCEWPEASFAIGSPFLTSKNGGVNTDDSPHPSQKISQISDYNNQLGGFNPVEYVSQQTTMFSLLETKHTQPRIDS